jgi:hypothetical protein
LHADVSPWLQATLHGARRADRGIFLGKLQIVAIDGSDRNVYRPIAFHSDVEYGAHRRSPAWRRDRGKT